MTTPTPPPNVPVQPYVPPISGYFDPTIISAGRGVFTPPGPGGLYDEPTSVITVNPEIIDTVSSSARSVIQELLSSVSIINTTLSNLALSWVGQSATDAQDFTNQWNTEMQTLLNAANALSNALSSAAYNYSSTEGSLEVMLSQVAGSLESAIASAASSAPASNTTPAGQTNVGTPPDQNVLPITETY